MYIQSLAEPNLYLNSGTYNEGTVLSATRYGWKFSRKASGKIVIQSRSGAYLTLLAGSSVVTVGDVATEWKLQQGPLGHRIIIASGEPKRCLDVYDPVAGPVQLWRCTKSAAPHQMWRIEPMEPMPPLEIAASVPGPKSITTKTLLVDALVDFIDRAPGYKLQRAAIALAVAGKDFEKLLNLLPIVATQSKLPKVGRVQLPAARQGTLFMVQPKGWERFIGLLRLLFAHSKHPRFPTSQWEIKHHGMDPHVSLGRDMSHNHVDTNTQVTFTLKPRAEFFQQEKSGGYNVAVQPYWITLPVTPDPARIRSCPYGCHFSIAFLWHK